MARPRNSRNPQQSVKVVTKTVEARAGSMLTFFRMTGTRKPVTVATTMNQKYHVFDHVEWIVFWTFLIDGTLMFAYRILIQDIPDTPENRANMRGIGYREWQPYLDGQADLAATVALIQKHSHQFAKRQYTWLNHQMPVHWFDSTKEAEQERILTEIQAWGFFIHTASGFC